ncbi:hypothetical protein D3C71_1964260 [compost metagenome]
MISSSCSLLIYVSGVREGDYMLKRMHDSMAYRKNRRSRIDDSQPVLVDGRLLEIPKRELP